MTAASVAETARDSILAAISREQEVPVEEIMHSRARQAVDARRVAMWVLADALDAGGVGELFDTTARTVDDGLVRVWNTMELRELAQKVLREHGAELRSLRASQRSDVA